MQRKIVPIRKSPSYVGAKSVSSVYELIKRDPRFASLWFRILGRTVAFEDSLVAYAEDRSVVARAFPPPPQPKRKRGRPRKPSSAEQVVTT